MQSIILKGSKYLIDRGTVRFKICIIASNIYYIFTLFTFFINQIDNLLFGAKQKLLLVNKIFFTINVWIHWLHIRESEKVRFQSYVSVSDLEIWWSYNSCTKTEKDTGETFWKKMIYLNEKIQSIILKGSKDSINRGTVRFKICIYPFYILH